MAKRPSDNQPFDYTTFVWKAKISLNIYVGYLTFIIFYYDTVLDCQDPNLSHYRHESKLATLSLMLN